MVKLLEEILVEWNKSRFFNDEILGICLNFLLEFKRSVKFKNNQVNITEDDVIDLSLQMDNYLKNKTLDT